MSWEVYIDVAHHHKHDQGDGEKLNWCARYVEPGDLLPSTAEKMRAVVNGLREMADEYDPDALCSNCGAYRHAHHGYPSELPRCFNRLGPVAQAKWWSFPTDRSDDGEG